MLSCSTALATCCTCTLPRVTWFTNCSRLRPLAARLEPAAAANAEHLKMPGPQPLPQLKKAKLPAQHQMAVHARRSLLRCYCQARQTSRRGSLRWKARGRAGKSACIAHGRGHRVSPSLSFRSVRFPELHRGALPSTGRRLLRAADIYITAGPLYRPSTGRKVRTRSAGIPRPLPRSCMHNI